MPMTTIADLTHDPKNARKHGKRNLDTIAKSLEECGAARSIVIDENGVILAGNGLVEAAGQLGIENVQIVEADGNTIIAVRRTGLTAKQKKRLALFDNRSAEHAEWNPEALAELVAEDFDFKDLFSTDEIDAILAELMEPDGGLLATADPDAIPENVETRCKQGDLWQLGRHRLLCGDSTNPLDVERLMGGASPNLMITDPPYGVEYDANWRNEMDRANGKPYGAFAVGKVSNDDAADWTEAWVLFQGDVVYCWHADRRASIVQSSLESAGFEMRSQIIWAKSNFAISRGHYHWQHEPCWYAVRKGSNASWIGDHSQTTLWEIDKPMKSETGHSTQKPLDCMARAIRNHDGDVYDPFLGSGTTLIAAEQENRVCYGLEIEPKYCDVILTRWENATGKTATLITE